MKNARRTTGVGIGAKFAPRAAVGAIADDQIAGKHIDLLPIVVNKGRRGARAWMKSQQTRAPARLGDLVERPGEYFLLNIGGITGGGPPAFFHIDRLEFE